MPEILSRSPTPGSGTRLTSSISRMEGWSSWTPCGTQPLSARGRGPRGDGYVQRRNPPPRRFRFGEPGTRRQGGSGRGFRIIASGISTRRPGAWRRARSRRSHVTGACHAGPYAGAPLLPAARWIAAAGAVQRGSASSRLRRSHRFDRSGPDRAPGQVPVPGREPAVVHAAR